MVASAEKLSFSLFGGFRIACTWRSEIEVRQARAQRLLAYLLLNRTTSPTRQRVAFAFWPDTPERQALNNLRTLLHRLRQTLPEIDQFLDLDAEILRWRSPENLFLDVARFEETLDEASEATACRDLQLEELLLESALQLYQGDLLPDYYDEWVTSTRDRLRAAYLDATERLAVLKQGQRKYADASVHVRALLQADPLRESGYRLLMQLRLAEGDRASALRAYHTCATRLRRELGVEPDPATQQLYERVLQADSAASFAPAEFALREDPSPAPVPLVGRRAEWARLVEIYQEALRGKPRAVLLTGEAGIGRTRLADEFLTYARQQGAAVASASCRSSSAVVAYAPLTAWLRSPTLRDHVRQAPHALAQEVSRLLEPLSPAHDRPRAAGEAAWQHRQLWDALVGVLIGRGRTPLVLSIDDIHWSDPLTLDWISYALQMAPSAPVVVLLTSPSSEPVSNMRLAAVRTELQERGVWVELPLEPFTLEDSAELARHALGASVTSEQVGRLHEATEGNPLFLIETIYARAEQVFERSLDGPPNHGDCPGCSDPIVLTPRIENVLRRRLDMLSEPAQSLAEIAAVIGREFTLGVLMRAARLPTDELLGALDEVWRQQLIRDRGDEHYDFSHELLRATIYEGLSPVRRKLIHHRVATALEEAGGAGTAADAALLAHHFSLAGNPRRAAEFWLAAGEWHRLLMAGQEAAGHFRRAAEAWQAAGEPERAARAFMKAGLAFQADFDSTQANEAYDAGFALWQQSRPPRASVSERATKVLRTHWTEPVSLDPTAGCDFMSSAVITQLYSGLACHGHDFEVTPDLAAGWVVRDDGRRYIVHLRHDGTWNDGEPVTAHDFDAGWKSTLDPATGSAHAQLLYDIRGARDYHTGKSCDPDTLGIRAIDDFTLEVELEAPAPYFPHLLAHPATLPQPRHAFQGRPAGGEVLSECISNGPFMVDEWEHGRRMHLVRNPRYHGRWHGNLEGVTLELDIPPAEALRRYDADELDVVRLSSDSTMQELVHVQRNYAGEFLSGPRLATWQLGFDTSRPPFDDARVRRAFALTCDRERLANGLLKGLFTPATGGFVPPGMPGHTPNTALPFDPVEGRRLLAEAGYAGGTGFPHVTLWTDQWAADVIDAMAAEWWRLLNIGVETRSLPWGEFVQRMEREPVQMYYSAWRADYPDPDSFLRSGLRWHATQWHDPAYEELLRRAQLALNSADRLRSYRDAEEHLVRSAGIVPVAYGRLYLIMKPRVRRYRFSGIRPWFLSDVVIDD